MRPESIGLEAVILQAVYLHVHGLNSCSRCEIFKPHLFLIHAICYQKIDKKKQYAKQSF
jgi:hypothetical protein